MSARIAAPEETRDALALDGPQTVAQLAVALHVSPSTIRRHLAELRARGQVALAPASRPRPWAVTSAGRAASDANEPL